MEINPESTTDTATEATLPTESPHHIARIETGRTLGWQVRVTRQGTRHTRFFSDGVCGGRAEALEAAIVYRDELLKTLPERMDRGDAAKKAGESRNALGVAGLHLTLRAERRATNAPKKTWVLVAQQPYQGARRSFSLDKWPLRKAVWQAVAFRFEGDALMAPHKRDELLALYRQAYKAIGRELKQRKRALKKQAAAERKERTQREADRAQHEAQTTEPDAGLD
ncbi:MAG: hypothetical protein AAF970_18145 [Bacteroidota bacterium]